mmetsp:Transcript_11378/g.19861  ORF Transcript_11378/g.19861 Transcript_11378/m.19861 type:complete len:229 (+) Transcript_11378:730-1416(+)
MCRASPSRSRPPPPRRTPRRRRRPRARGPRRRSRSRSRQGRVALGRGRRVQGRRRLTRSWSRCSSTTRQRRCWRRRRRTLRRVRLPRTMLRPRTPASTRTRRTSCESLSAPMHCDACTCLFGRICIHIPWTRSARSMRKGGGGASRQEGSHRPQGPPTSGPGSCRFAISVPQADTPTRNEYFSGDLVWCWGSVIGSLSRAGRDESCSRGKDTAPHEASIYGFCWWWIA